MTDTLKDWLIKLEQNDLLLRVTDTTPINQIARIVDHNYRKATLFEHVHGYDMPLVANTFSNREMIKLALETDEAGLFDELEARMKRLIAPVAVTDAACQEIVVRGGDVNLADMPLHLQHEFDGAPFISAGVVVARDPERGVINLGIYRLMYRGRNETGIDVTGPTKLKHYYEVAHARGEPLEVAVVIGLPTLDIMAALASSPLDIDEYHVLGGFRGEAAELVQCKTVDLPVPANAEIVFEGVIGAEGWVIDEGPYGEFTGTYGSGMKWNPTVTVNAITRRKDAVFHSATHGGNHPGWTDIYVLFCLIELDLYKALKQAGIDVRGVRVVPAGLCNWAVASIKPLTQGDARNALTLMLAASKQAMPKYAVVVDDDIDIFDDEQLYWAMSWRSQPHEDTLILTDMKAVTLDPSLPTSMPPVTTSKMGIDATIPIGRNRADFERCYPAVFEPGVADQTAIEPAALDERLLDVIARHGPCYFYDILNTLSGVEHRLILESFGRIRERQLLDRDEVGRYVVR